MRWPSCSVAWMRPPARTDRLRLFFALWPEDAVRQSLAQAARELRGCPGRAVPPANFHLTLAFLADVSPERLPTLHALGDRLVLPAFTLTLDRWGSFPGPGVLWLGPSAVPQALVSFEQVLWAELSVLGFRRDHPGFVPHVTLRRRAGRAVPASAPAAVRWRVGGWALVRSTRDTGASAYTPERWWPTGPNSAGPRDLPAAGLPDS